MRFYVEFKWPELADYYGSGKEEYIPWTPELRKLIEIHRLYRKWLQKGASEVEDSSIQILDKSRRVPQYILDELASITQVFASVDYLYPGLEICKNYHSNDTSVSDMFLEHEFDLEAVANNEAGFPLEKKLIDKLIPSCKWISGTIDLPIDMTLVQLIKEESSSKGSTNYWWYIERDVELRIAGISLHVYMPNGTKALTYVDTSSLVLGDLSGMDLSKVSRLSGRDLSNTNLSGVNLRGTNLKGCNLNGANLSGANYDNTTQWPDGFDYQNSGAIGPNANLSNVDLRTVNFTGVHLQEVNLKDLDLKNVDFTKALYDKTTQWPDSFDYQNSGAIGPNANLSNVDLGGVNLRSVDLNGANLSGVNLRGTNLKGCNLNGANLSGANYDNTTQWPDGFDYQNSGAIGPNANLSNVDLRTVNFTGVHLQEVNLKDLDLKNVDFTKALYDKTTQWPDSFDYQNSGAIGPNANLREANLRGVNLQEADLRKANLQGADLTKANLRGAILAGANLQGANLSDVDFTETDLTRVQLLSTTLTGADLSSANLSGADLSGSNLSGAKYDNETQWPDGFDFQSSGSIGPWQDKNLKKSNLSGKNLTEAVLKGSDLSEANMQRVNLTKADLTEATLEKTNLDYANLSEANLQGANLQEACLLQANLREVNLEGANLQGANLNGSKLVGANLQGANLSKTNLDYADLSEANLQGANLQEATLRRDLEKANKYKDTVLYGASYDENTQWPEGFDPVAAGAILKED